MPDDNKISRCDVHEKEIEVLSHEVFGNGQDGLHDIVQRLDQSQQTMLKVMWWIAGGIGTIITSLIIAGIIALISFAQAATAGQSLCGTEPVPAGHTVVSSPSCGAALESESGKY